MHPISERYVLMVHRSKKVKRFVAGGDEEELGRLVDGIQQL
jgi:hypothetical protein